MLIYKLAPGWHIVDPITPSLESDRLASRRGVGRLGHLKKLEGKLNNAKCLVGLFREKLLIIDYIANKDR